MKNGIHYFGEKDYLFSKYSDQNPMQKKSYVKFAIPFQVHARVAKGDTIFCYIKTGATVHLKNIHTFSVSVSTMKVFTFTVSVATVKNTALLCIKYGYFIAKTGQFR